MLYSAKEKGGFGAWTLSRGCRNGAVSIMDCFSTMIRIRLMEGIPCEVAAISPWREGFPPKNRFVCTSWRERPIWRGRSTNHYRVRQSEVFTMTCAADDLGTIVGPRFDVTNFVVEFYSKYVVSGRR